LRSVNSFQIRDRFEVLRLIRQVIGISTVAGTFSESTSAAPGASLPTVLSLSWIIFDKQQSRSACDCFRRLQSSALAIALDPFRSESLIIDHGFTEPERYKLGVES